MGKTATQDNRPKAVVRCERNCSDLTAIAPLGAHEKRQEEEDGILATDAGKALLLLLFVLLIFGCRLGLCFYFLASGRLFLGVSFHVVRPIFLLLGILDFFIGLLQNGN